MKNKKIWFWLVSIMLVCTLFAGTCYQVYAWVAERVYVYNYNYPTCPEQSHLGRAYDPQLSSQMEECVYEGDVYLQGYFEMVVVDGQSVPAVRVSALGATTCWQGTPEDESVVEHFPGDRVLTIPLQDEAIGFDMTCRNAYPEDSPAYFHFEIPSIQDIQPGWERVL